jgi:hypothetical protein
MGRDVAEGGIDNIDGEDGENGVDNEDLRDIGDVEGEIAARDVGEVHFARDDEGKNAARDAETPPPKRIESRDATDEEARQAWEGVRAPPPRVRAAAAPRDRSARVAVAAAIAATGASQPPAGPTNAAPLLPCSPVLDHGVAVAAGSSNGDTTALSHAALSQLGPTNLTEAHEVMSQNVSERANRLAALDDLLNGDLEESHLESTRIQHLTADVPSTAVLPDRLSSDGGGGGDGGASGASNSKPGSPIASEEIGRRLSSPDPNHFNLSPVSTTQSPPFDQVYGDSAALSAGAVGAAGSPDGEPNISILIGPSRFHSWKSITLDEPDLNVNPAPQNPQTEGTAEEKFAVKVNGRAYVYAHACFLCVHCLPPWSFGLSMVGCHVPIHSWLPCAQLHLYLCLVRSSCLAPHALAASRR